MPRPLRVLFLLDEFAQLGRVQAFENLAAMGAGMGIQLWPVVQDLNQLHELYGDRWETFVANSGCRIFFRPNDKFTSDYLSALCGQTEVLSCSHNVNHDPQGNISVSNSASQSARPLLLPHELRELPDSKALLFADCVRGPALINRKPYYRTPEFNGKWCPDPYHAGEAASENKGGLKGAETALEQWRRLRRKG